MKTFSLLLIFGYQVFFNNPVLAQSAEVDSLKNLLSGASEDTMKCKILSDLIDVAADGEWQVYNLQLGELSEKLIGNENSATKRIGKKSKGIYFNNLAYEFAGKGDYSNALDYYERSSKIYSEIGELVEKTLVLSSTGAIYDRLGETELALKIYLEALALQQNTTQFKNLTATLNNIAVIYAKKNDLDKQIQYLQEALNIAETHHLKNQITVNLIKGIGDNFNKRKEIEKSIEYYKKGLALSEELVDNSGTSANLAGLAADYFELGRIREAKEFALRSFAFANKIDFPIDIENSSKILGNIYEKQGDYRRALEMFKIAKQTRDTINRQENQKSVIRHQFQSEYDKKEFSIKAEQETKDAIAQKELQKQKLLKNGFLAGFGIVLLFALIFFRQRNHIKKGNAALKIAKERAEQSEQFKQQFLANMSHEIRTPMNAVMGMTSLVLDTPLKENQKFYLEGIKKSSDNLLHIINDILDLSKIEAGKMDLEKIDFSLSAVVEQVKQTLLHRAEEKGLELLIDIESGISDVVVGDPGRLIQILINLTGNAIKFTEKGSVTIEIKNGVSSADYKFSIIDTGIGIPKNKLKTVFESFSQVNASDTRKYGGTGLGLSISRQLVELMGGKISVESTEGSGTTFSFEVSLEKGSADKLADRLASEENVDGTILNGLNILIIDDNEYNRIVAKDTLESKSKAWIMAVGSAQEGFKLLQEKKFDIVLMDVQMPLMNGFEATQHIRTKLSAPLKNIPIIALTASVLRTDIDKCKNAGMNSYIPKPFKASQLIKGIAGVLNIKLKSEKQKSTHQEKGNISSGRVTDIKVLSTFCEGDRERMKKYIELFTSSVPEIIEKILRAEQDKNFSEIANQAHAFKTKSMMMGMTVTKDLAQKIEKKCREINPDPSVSQDISLFISHIKLAIDELAEV